MTGVSNQHELLWRLCARDSQDRRVRIVASAGIRSPGDLAPFVGQPAAHADVHFTGAILDMAWRKIPQRLISQVKDRFLEPPNIPDIQRANGGVHAVIDPWPP